MMVTPKTVLWGSKKVKEEYFLNSKYSISMCFLSRFIAQQNMPSSPVLVVFSTFAEGGFHQLQAFCFSLQLLLKSDGVFWAESGILLKQIWVSTTLPFHEREANTAFEPLRASMENYYRKAHKAGVQRSFANLSEKYLH